jgi:hypothetical protein
MKDLPEPWRRLAARSLRRINFAWGMDLLSPLLIGLGVLLLAAGFLCRQYLPDHFGWVYGGLCGSALAVLGVIAAVRYRKKCVNLEGVLARLDRVLGLNNALTTASAGRGGWPALEDGATDGVKFDLGRILVPVLLAVAMVLAGLLIPVRAGHTSGPPVPPPRSHEEIAAAIAQLEQSDAVRKEDLEKLNQELAALKEQSPEEWYQHSSLEAADHLQEGMKDQLRGLAQNLNQARSSLAGLESAGDSPNPEEQKRLAQEFKSAMQGLKDSPLGLNEKLMSALSKVDPSALKSLNPDDLKKMMDGMKQAAGACQKCAGGKCSNPGSGDAQSELEKLLGDNPGDGSGKPKDGGGDGPSRGGVSRGPGVAPLPLSSQPADLKTNNPASLQSEDLKRTRPGDAIGTSDTEHHLDKSPVGPQNAGNVNASGRGGDSVWRDSLLPQEKAVLQKYFK